MGCHGVNKIIRDSITVIRKTSYLLQSILERVHSMYSVNLTESVLGCLYVTTTNILLFIVFNLNP